MATVLATAIDRRLQQFIVTRARRRNPVLRVVPARWIGLVVAPAATRLRCSLVRIAVAASIAPAAVGVMALLG